MPGYLRPWGAGHYPQIVTPLIRERRSARHLPLKPPRGTSNCFTVQARDFSSKGFGKPRQKALTVVSPPSALRLCRRVIPLAVSPLFRFRYPRL
jgi:hypothetical protein